jgi:hypothetical protein
MHTTQVEPSASRAAGPEITRVDAGRSRPTAPPPATTCPPQYDEQSIIEEITAEQASRLAVTALATDLEYWARTVSVDSRVGLNDLTRALDAVRDASVPTA